MSDDRAKYNSTINAIKNLVLPVESVKTEDIPNLIRILSWGLPEERVIINDLFKQLRKRNALDYFIKNM
ncbi:hypothetical protein ACFLTH_05175 [Bacteroidota bacterium]